MIDWEGIVIHCSFTPEGRPVTVDEIRRWHVEGNGWSDIGYNGVVLIDGSYEDGRDTDGDGEIFDEVGAHAYGYNRKYLGIVYIGGMDKDGNPKDTRTPEQNAMLVKKVFEWKSRFGIKNENIIGHNEVSNKSCPCFDVRKWIEELKWED